MAEIKTINDISQSTSEIPRRLTKDGVIDAELNEKGEIIKSGAPVNPVVFKTIEEPKRFIGKNGLEDINLNLLDCSGKYFEFEYFCENNLIKSAFNDNTNETPLASFIIKSDSVNSEKWINYKPYNCNESIGIASANTITYENVYDNVDIKYENRKKDIKQYITLKDPSAQNVFDFTISTCNGISLISEELPVLAIQYTGSSPVGSIEVNSNNHLIGRTQSTTAFDLDLNDSDYDTLQEVVDYIDGLSTWSASIKIGSGSCRSKTLSIIGQTNCKANPYTLNAELKGIKSVNPEMPNSRIFWEIRRPFANSDRSGSDTSYGFIELIPSTEHENGVYDVIRITIDPSWISNEFSSGATEIVIDPTTYRIIRDYGNITLCGDYSYGNQHGPNGFMNGYGVINRGTEAVQTGGTRVENDNASITYIDPDGTEYAGGAANKGQWTYVANAGYSGGSIHRCLKSYSLGAKVKLTFTGTEIWLGCILQNGDSIVKSYIDGEFYGYIDLYNSSSLTQQKVLIATGLTNDSHIVELEVVAMSNISYVAGSYGLIFDFFEYYTSGNELTSRDVITINGRSTYGLDCTYAKHPNGINYDSRGNLLNDTGGDNAEGSFSCILKPNFDANSGSTNNHYIFAKNAAVSVSGDMICYYSETDDMFHFSIYNGADWSTVDVQSASQTFSSGDVLSLICTWDETLGANLYINNIKTSDTSTWTAVDLAGSLTIGNNSLEQTPSSSQQANMIIAEPTFFDYVLTDEEIYDIYVSTTPIWEMDFGRRVEVLNRTNDGLLFNYSGVIGADHRIGSFAGVLYDTSTPTGTAIAEANVTFTGTWTDSGNYRYTADVNAYMTDTTPACTELWACFYAGTSRGIAEYIIDEGTSQEKHVLIDQYHTANQDRYALIATGLESKAHTIKIKMKNLRNISSSGNAIYVGLNGTADSMYLYTTSGSENITSNSLTFNNRLIDNVLNCNYTDMPHAITFLDKGNISEYDYEGTIRCLVKTTWAGDDSTSHLIFSTRDSTPTNGLQIKKTNGNNLQLRFDPGDIEINVAVDSSNWAANTEHHILARWWRPTSSTIGASIYLDGVKLAENKSQSFTPTSHSVLVIGNELYSIGDVNDFEGNILDLSIYNHAFDDGGISTSSAATIGSEVYNDYHEICRKYKENLSSQVDGATTTFYLSRGLIDSTSYTSYMYDDSTSVIISSFKEGTYCRANGNILSTDTTIQVDSFTNDESEIDTNGGYLYIGQVNQLWRKKLEYSSYDSTSHIFVIADSGTVGEDFPNNIIIEVCGTVTVDTATVLGSDLRCTYYYTGDSIDREYGLIPDKLNKNLWLDDTGADTTGWQASFNSTYSGMERIQSHVRGQCGLFYFDKSNFIMGHDIRSSGGIPQIIINQGTKDEKSYLFDFYNSSQTYQHLDITSEGLNNQSIARHIVGVSKNASSTNYTSAIDCYNISSQYDLTKESLNSNDVNCVFDYSAIRVIDGQLDYDRDISGNLQLKYAIASTDTTIYVETDTASDIDRLGRPYGIFKVDNEFIYYNDISDSTGPTEIILLNCIRGYMSDLTGGSATTHSGATSIQLVGSWRNNVNAMNKSWYPQCGGFPYRALMIASGSANVAEGGLTIRDLDNNRNYMIFESALNNVFQVAPQTVSGHTGKIVCGCGIGSYGITDIDFINDEILLHHSTGYGYGSAASTKGNIAQRNDSVGYNYTTHTGVAITQAHCNHVIIYFDATNYNVWGAFGKSGTTGSSAGIVRIYDGGDGLLDVEYDLDSDSSYWSTKLCYDISNDDLYVSQTNGSANQDIWSKIGSPKISADSTIDTADGTSRLTSQPICNDISLEGSSNIWFASDTGAKSVVKSTFSSIANTLDSTSFTELTLNSCQTIDYDPCDTKLLIGFGDSNDGLLINCDVSGLDPIYYDKSSETDADRNNVLSSDIFRDICNIYQDYREIGSIYSLNDSPGWAIATNIGITIKEPEAQTYSLYADPDITESNNVYTMSITGTPRRETLITESSGVYTRTLDISPNVSPMVDKIITESNGVYTSTDQS